MLRRVGEELLHSYFIPIDAYYKNNKVEAAMNLFQEIRHKGLAPDTVTYTTVVQRLFGAGRYLSAKEVFGEIQAASLKPSFHTSMWS